MKIFIFGSNGMLGFYVNNYLKLFYKIISFTRNNYDIFNNNFDQLLLLFKKFNLQKNDIIINCAGLIPQRINSIENNYIIKRKYIIINSLFPNKLNEVLKISNIFLINHEEALQLTGIKNVKDAACHLHSLGPNVVIIKMGEKGAYLSYNESSFYIPVFPVNKVIDPTGAGDSFAGGLMGFLAHTEEPDFLDAVLMGSAMASYCIEDFGPTSLLKVTMDGLNSRVESIKNSMFSTKGI